MAGHTHTTASRGSPGLFIALLYPDRRRVEISVPDALGSIVAQRNHIEQSRVEFAERQADGTRRVVSSFEFDSFADFAGAREARAALASYSEGDRALALSHANLAASHHAGWSPLVSLLMGKGS